jgi:hypothetical protein
VEEATGLPSLSDGLAVVAVVAEETEDLATCDREADPVGLVSSAMAAVAPMNASVSLSSCSQKSR